MNSCFPIFSLTNFQHYPNQNKHKNLIHFIQRALYDILKEFMKLEKTFMLPFVNLTRHKTYQKITKTGDYQGKLNF